MAVGAGGEIVWAEGFGWADLESKVPVAPDTRFRIGTASTALTSAAVGLLLEKGRLKLDDEIQTYVPEFPEKQWPVTLRQLMGHVAGVRNDGGDEGPLLVGATASVRSKRCSYFTDSPLRFEPGTQYRYSSYGWILLSAAVEAAADEPFLSFMRRQIFEPLGMDRHRGRLHDRADPESGDALLPAVRGESPLRPGPDARTLDYSCYAGSSAFLSTPSDLVRFAMAIDSGKLLQPATVQLLQTSQRLASGQETGYGLGWDLETVAVAGRPTTVVGHDGEFAGRDGGVSHDVPRARDRRGRDVEHLLRGHVRSSRVKIAQAFAEQRRTPAPR